MSVEKYESIKVCHVTSAHSRFDLRIFRKECISLVDFGYNVYFIVNDDKLSEVVEGVKIVSTEFNPRSRLDRWLGSKKYIKRKMSEIDADIYHFHDPDLLPLAKCIVNKGKKAIFDFHEDVPQQILDKTYIPKIWRRPLSILYRMYEIYICKHLSAIIVSAPHMVENYKRINSNISVVTNYPILKSIDLNKNRETSKIVCFAGSIDHRWNHDKIISAINEIDSIEYYLAGDSGTTYFNRLKEIEGWNKVRFFGRIPFEQVSHIYEKSFVGLALLGNNELTNEKGTLGITKMFEYMEAGLPVICSNFPTWKAIVDKYGCGITINSNSSIEIKNAIVKLVNNPSLANVMGKNGRIAIEKEFNWDSQAKNLNEIYKNSLL